MDLASALTAPVPGRGAQEGARSRSESGTPETESFDTVLNDVNGAADVPPAQTDDAAAEQPPVAAVNDATAFAGSVQQAAVAQAAQPFPLAAGLPAPAGTTPAADQQSATPATADAPGPQPLNTVPAGVTTTATPVATATSVAAGSAPPGVPATGRAAGAVPGQTTTPILSRTGSATAQAGATAATESTAAAPAASSAAPPSSAAATTTLAAAVTAAAVTADGASAAVPAEGQAAGPSRHETIPAPAATEALAAAGTAAAATVPAGQPTSSATAPPQPAPPQPAPSAAAQPGAALQPQLAKPLFTLAGAPQGQHIMTLQLSPEDLGPMTVRAHIDAAGVRIELFAPGDAGREAIRGILPELRKELADAGFGASLDVSERSGPGSTGRDGTGQDPGRNGSGPDPGGPGISNGPGVARPGHRWEALADASALRNARILNGPQTTLDILV